MENTWTKLIDAEELAAGVRRAGARIAQDYRGEELVLVGLLQGAVFFLADLARAVGAPVRIETMRPHSYGGARASSGRVELLEDLREDIRGRHVLVVDDIYDSGRTLRFVLDHLATRQPKSLAVACLLVKDAARAAEVEVKYGLFPIPDVFVVGAGLDLRGLGRNLPDVWGLGPGVSEQAALAELVAKLGG
ncbi:MAG TPA: hypoxanthine phosphoribosyltransferase [Terriglobales bacterium]|nr:hypoxanthine phosphoribosyltransferase [Terriglobales bacterium]